MIQRIKIMILNNIQEQGSPYFLLELMSNNSKFFNKAMSVNKICSSLKKHHLLCEFCNYLLIFLLKLDQTSTIHAYQLKNKNKFVYT